MKHILIQFTRRKSHPAIQFIKYGMAGVVATVVHMSIFYFLCWKVFPALQADDFAYRLLRDFLGFDVVIHPVEEALRARRFVICNAIAFVFSNLTCYLINAIWVFEPGRHKRHVEVGLFYGVSLFSMLVGTSLGWAMIHFLSVSTTTSFIGNLVASVLINYVCRKYIVFKG